MGKQALDTVRSPRMEMQAVSSDSACQLLTGPSACLHSAVRGTLLSRYRLTPRQLEVLELVAEGKGPRAVAAALCLSPRSIEDHIHDLHTRLGTADRTELVALWLALVYEIVDMFGLALQLHEPDEPARIARSTGKEP